MGMTIRQELELLASRIEWLDAVKEAAQEVVRAVEATHDHTQWFKPLADLSRALKG